jgi:hypothetical protein
VGYGVIRRPSLSFDGKGQAALVHLAIGRRSYPATVAGATEGTQRDSLVAPYFSTGRKSYLATLVAHQ